jgi:hypothetical protein
MTLTEKIKAVDELARLIQINPLVSVKTLSYEDDPEQEGVHSYQTLIFRQFFPPVSLLIREGATRDAVLSHLKKLQEHVSTAQWPIRDGNITLYGRIDDGMQAGVHYDGEMLRAVADNIDTPNPDMF